MTSASTTQKYLGAPGLIILLVVIPVWTFLIVTPLATRLSKSATWVTSVLAVLLLAFVTLCVTIGYPLSQSGAFGVGSDRADALEIAALRTLTGLHPYEQFTYLGNPITPLPGAVLLAVPFFLIFGTVILQNAAWIAATLATIRICSKSTAVTIVLGSTIILAPESIRDFSTGGDLFTNGCYVMVSTTILINIPRHRLLPISLAALLWGLTICSRFHFALIILVTLPFIAYRAGLRPAMLAGSVSIATAALLAIPLYLSAPASFSPVHVFSLTTGNTEIGLPLIAQALAAAVGAVAVGLIIRKSTKSVVYLWCSILLVSPGIIAAGYCIYEGRFDEILNAMTLALPCLPFAALSWAIADNRTYRSGVFFGRSSAS